MYKVLVLSLLIILMPSSAFARKCSDRAFSIYLDCLSVKTELYDLYHDSDLYSEWEKDYIMKRHRKCEKFEETDRYSDCVGRHRFGTEKWREMFPD